ncbi:MAG: D-alanyl-D-alanine carboxypeptidase [Rhodobacterales bacterium]|nr:MAG: D-alanyl-D-alanine carboxypeptidase [Rhodobacterales bacterium]
MVLVAFAALPARAFETKARAALVYDLTTNTVLLQKNADTPLPPASMSKLMTLNMLFEALRDGRVMPDTRFAVSQRAQDMGGSTMFLNTSDRPTVEELIQGIVVNSGNDACVAVAEGLASTEEAFAALMTERARALGMKTATFGNASGWPHPQQRMSMRDLAILATRLITEFPEYYHFFSQTEFSFAGRAPDNRFNRNPLLKLGIGADGLKTGHTSEAGYGLVGSSVQGGRRIVFVISGLASDAERASEAEAVINWAFRQFAMKTPVRAGVRVAELPVFLGAQDNVGLVAAHDVTLLLPIGADGRLAGKISWTSPLKAPVAQGQALASMVLSRPGMDDITVPLYAETGVAPAGFAARVRRAALLLVDRVMGPAPEPLPAVLPMPAEEPVVPGSALTN